MSKKSDLKKQIEEGEKEIEELEKKRTRSQSSLMEALLAKAEPNAADVEYFRVYTQLINLERENLQKLKEELKKLG